MVGSYFFLIQKCNRVFRFIFLLECFLFLLLMGFQLYLDNLDSSLNLSY
jgi:hypothetical protein